MSKASRRRRTAAKVERRGMTDFKNLARQDQKFAILEELAAMVNAITKGVRIEMRLNDSFYERWHKAKNPDIKRSEQTQLIMEMALELLAEARYRCRHKSYPDSWRGACHAK